MTFPFSTIYPSISLQFFFGHEKKFQHSTSFAASSSRIEKINKKNKRATTKSNCMGRSYTTFNTIRRTEFICGYTKKRTKSERFDPFQHGMRMGKPEYLSDCMGHFVFYFTCPFGYRIFVLNTSSTLAYCLLRLCKSDVSV
jgi:hypothetical protein